MASSDIPVGRRRPRPLCGSLLAAILCFSFWRQSLQFVGKPLPEQGLRNLRAARADEQKRTPGGGPAEEKYYLEDAFPGTGDYQLETPWFNVERYRNEGENQMLVVVFIGFLVLCVVLGGLASLMKPSSLALRGE
eukprot:TRINITY_DN99218_c0_g1_i1.p1 TRINITY_DN99218_c0_g1~~TRINITY_DN99218_c0_g1_i1.p1  ORF type:complete len:135 (+),score=29.63 TRINITY_DN99218_c0_g1_i1:56-460(+)